MSNCASSTLHCPPPKEFCADNYTTVLRKIKAIAPPASPASKFKEPIKDLTSSQISLLDPTGARTSLFSRTNPEAAKVGDILLVRLKTGDPFAGVCINIRRRGIDTGILLRNELTRVGVEMWYKIYSPNVEGIEVVQRKEKRARRARLTYMRKPKHDMGSVQNIVLQYQRTRGALRGSAGKDDKNKGGKKKGKGRK
jgi:large subunit ribosomal protein L19